MWRQYVIAACALDDGEAIGTQAADGDRVGIVPCLAQQHDAGTMFAMNIQKHIQLG